MGWRPASSIMRHPLTYSPQELLGLHVSLQNLVCTTCRARRQEILDSMTPTTGEGGGNFRGKKCEIDVYL